MLHESRSPRDSVPGDGPFRDAIDATPGDDAPRLIYQDFRDESGMPETAALARLQVYLNRQGKDECNHPRAKAQLAAVWRGELQAPEIPVPGISIAFCRGNLSKLRIDVEVLDDFDPAIFEIIGREFEVRELLVTGTLITPFRYLPQLADAFPYCTDLTIENTPVIRGDLESSVRRWKLYGLTLSAIDSSVSDIPGGVDDIGRDLMATLATMETLRELKFLDTRLFPSVIALLPYLPQLEHLVLQGGYQAPIYINRAWCRAIANNSRLDTLRLVDCHIASGALKELGWSSTLKALSIGREGCYFPAPLSRDAAARLRQLDTIEVMQCDSTSRALRGLVSGGGCNSLRWLGTARDVTAPSPFNHKTASKVASSRVTSLEIDGELDPASASNLAMSRSLVQLTLRKAEVGEDALSALGGSKTLTDLTIEGTFPFTGLPGVLGASKLRKLVVRLSEIPPEDSTLTWADGRVFGRSQLEFVEFKNIPLSLPFLRGFARRSLLTELHLRTDLRTVYDGDNRELPIPIALTAAHARLITQFGRLTVLALDGYSVDPRALLTLVGIEGLRELYVRLPAHGYWAEKCYAIPLLAALENPTLRVLHCSALGTLLSVRDELRRRLLEVDGEVYKTEKL